jgi:hypothetical protein
MTILDPQDAFAQLVEECRIGLVRRMMLLSNPDRVKYIPHKPDIEVADLPVFSLPERVIIGDDAVDGLEASQANRLHLPYSRCAFLYRVSATSPNLQKVPERWRRPIGRYYCVVAQAVDDGILAASFMRSDDHPHWSLQVWQAFISHGPAGGIEINYETDAIAGANAEFLQMLDQSSTERLSLLMGDIHRLTTTETGEVTNIPGTRITDKINQRRQKMNLGEVPRIRIVKFDAVVRPSSASTTKTGGTKKPHYRRGTWRKLSGGRQTWIPSSAIHGGGGDVPPWYEVR